MTTKTTTRKIECPKCGVPIELKAPRASAKKPAAKPVNDNSAETPEPKKPKGLVASIDDWLQS